MIPLKILFSFLSSLPSSIGFEMIGEGETEEEGTDCPLLGGLFIPP